MFWLAAGDDWTRRCLRVAVPVPTCGPCKYICSRDRKHCLHGKLPDTSPSKTTISAPCVIPRNFPWAGFPGAGKPLTGSRRCAALSRACCDSGRVSCSCRAKAALLVPVSGRRGVPCRDAVSGSLTTSAQVSCASSGSGRRAGGLRGLCHSRPVP